MTQTSLTKDLNQFIDKFQPNKYKLIHNGVEIRGSINIQQAIQEAKFLIERLELSLTVSHTADMLSYRGFEVNYRVA